MSVKPIFDKACQEIIAEIRARMASENVNATGKTSNSLEYSTTETGLTILGNKAFIWIEKGRRAGKNPPFSPILEWVEARGIGGSNPTAVAWAIVNDIGKRGTITFKGRSARDIYTSVVTQARIDTIVSQISNKKLVDIRSQVVTEFLKGKTNF